MTLDEQPFGIAAKGLYFGIGPVPRSKSNYKADF